MQTSDRLCYFHASTGADTVTGRTFVMRAEMFSDSYANVVIHDGVI